MLGKWGGAAAVETGNQSKVLGADGVTVAIGHNYRQEGRTVILKFITSIKLVSNLSFVYSSRMLHLLTSTCSLPNMLKESPRKVVDLCKKLVVVVVVVVLTCARSCNTTE